jgi:uncharacterized protein YoxC
MEPLSALSVACNIITITDTAVKTAKTLHELYNSTSGFSSKNENLVKETDHLKQAIEQLRQAGSQLTASQPHDANITRATDHCDQVVKSITAILDECRVKKPKSTRSVMKAWGKLHLKHSSNLLDLQTSLQSATDQLNISLVIATRSVLSPSSETFAREE